jgi:hypothetical protein
MSSGRTPTGSGSRRETLFPSTRRRCCTATHNGRPLRSEIEALVIEKKTHPEVCNIMFDRYGLRLFDYNLGNHMAKHAPNYAKALERLLQSELGEMLEGAMGPIVDQYKFPLAVVQVATHKLVQHPEEVSVADGIRAAEKLHILTQGLDVWHHGGVSQEEINTLIDIMQMVMTPKQRQEVRRRFGEIHTPVSAPEAEGPDTSGDDEVEGVVVDGEFIRLDQISTLPPEEPGTGAE